MLPANTVELVTTPFTFDELPAKDVLVEHMNEMVTVKGTLVSKGGVNMLYVTSVTPKK